MRPLALEIEGFLSYREPCLLDLSEIRAAAVLGENGAGKTSLVEAIAWALFGRGRGGPDAMVNEQGSRARVAFSFLLGDRAYSVERQRQSGASGKSYLGLSISRTIAPASLADADLGGWKPVGGDSIRETQAAIEDLLGMDGETWLATAFIAQGKADAFTNLGPAERKALLFDLLELGLWTDLAEQAKAQRMVAEGRARGAADAIAAIGQEPDLEAAEAEVEDLGLASLAAGHASAEAEEELERCRGAEMVASGDLARMEREAAEAARSLASAKAAAERLDDQIREEERSVEARDRRLDAIRLAEEEIPALEREEADANARIAELQREEQEVASREAARRADAAAARERSNAALREIERQRRRGSAWSSAGEDALCPTCEQPVDEEHRGKIEAEIREAFAAAAGQERDASAAFADADQAAGRWAARLREIREAIAAGQRSTARSRRLAEKRALVASADGLRLEAASGWARLERLRGEREAAAEAILAAQPEAAGSLEREAAITAAKERLRQAEEARSRATAPSAGRRQEHLLAAQRLAAAERGLESLRQRAQEIARWRSQREEAEQDAADWRLLARACGRDGIPSLLLEAELGALEAESNGLLATLTAGRLSLRLETLRALKGGGEKETLEILVGDAGGERRLEALSGGERQCVDLALRAALSRVLSRRAGRPIETLIIDEGFTALDAAHKQRTIEILHGLLSEFGCVLFVTHMEEMADAFPARILVSKDGSGSRAEVA